MLAITGAAGFIGSNLLAALEKASAGPIVAFDILESDAKRNNNASPCTEKLNRIFER